MPPTRRTIAFIPTRSSWVGFRESLSQVQLNSVLKVSLQNSVTDFIDSEARFGV